MFVGRSANQIYKVQELKDMLEERYKKVFIPGQNLLLDETLLRAFGRIKFKVQIIAKSARYGIQLYVVTDAETAFVLHVIALISKTHIILCL
jgi:Transposase IS4